MLRFNRSVEEEEEDVPLAKYSCVLCLVDGSPYISSILNLFEVRHTHSYDYPPQGLPNERTVMFSATRGTHKSKC